MKTLFSLMLACASFQGLQAQQVDSAALKIAEANLKVIGDYLDKKDSSLQKISNAVSFFTDLTGIASEAEGTYYGQYHPTRNDWKAWKSWIRRNREYIQWDKEVQSVVLFKKVRTEIL